MKLTKNRRDLREQIEKIFDDRKVYKVIQRITMYDKEVHTPLGEG